MGREFFAKYALLHKTARKLRSHFKSLCANSLEKLAGNFFELAGKQQGMILRKQGICSGVISSREKSSNQLRKTLELFCLSSDTYATLTYQQNRHKLIF
jgi:hypothetical protein